MVQPKMVYISNSTELGTIYSKAELTAIHDLCRAEGLLLFLDGARLGSALTCEANDLDLADIARLVDVFYIGGTKNGALLGEALVICRDDLKTDFRFLIKQRGALMAKGFVTGIQFEALFQDNLFFELAEHANHMAKRIAEAIKECCFPFYAPYYTNQLFPILPNALLEKLAEQFAFSVQAEIDEQHSAIRLVTSWATKEESVIALVEFLQAHRASGRSC
jgi:threonine aldolase